MDLINRIIHAITQTHPLHPMVVHFPIALTGAALFFILLALWKHKEFFEQAAFANIANGLPLFNTSSRVLFGGIARHVSVKCSDAASVLDYDSASITTFAAS